MNLCILPLQPEDINEILSWNADKGPEFLRQWAGKGYVHPLTYDQIAQRLTSYNADDKCQIFKILSLGEAGGRIIGTVELNTSCMPKRTAMVCRYLISPAYHNMGYGSSAMILLVGTAFNKMKYKALRLRVFAYNTRAVRCYEKAGFSIIETNTWDNNLTVYEMEIKAKQHKSKTHNN